MKIKEFLNSNQMDKNSLELLKQQWELCDNSEIGDKNRFGEILKEIHLIINKKKSINSSKPRRIILTLSKVAALLLIPILVTFFLLTQNSKPTNAKMELISTARGTMKKLNLPDGSKVWLNAESTLSYNVNNFNNKQRVVQIEGQAYFEVAKDPQKPFIVRGKEVSARVLGTKFDFCSYKDNTNVNVTLLEGSVMLTKSDEKRTKLYVLKPNQQVTFHKQSGKIDVKNVAAENSRKWIDGNLVFENEDFGQIALDLERHYNVTIQFKNDSIKQMRFYGRFSSSQTIDQVLSVMISSQKFSYSKKGNLIIFENRE